MTEMLLTIFIVLPIVLILFMPGIIDFVGQRLWVISRWVYKKWVQKSRYNFKRILLVIQIAVLVLVFGQSLYMVYEVLFNQSYPLYIIVSLAFSILAMFIIADLLSLLRGRRKLENVWHGHIEEISEKQNIIFINVQSFTIHFWLFCVLLGILPIVPEDPLFYYVALLLLPIVISSWVYLTDFLKQPTKYRQTVASFFVIVVASISFYQEFLSLIEDEEEANIIVAFLVPFFITIYSALSGFLSSFLPLVQHWRIFEKIKKEN